MNHDDDLDPRDALASAHLDGLTTALEAARIAADPDLQARVAALEAVRTALRAPVPIDHAARERTITAALAAAGPEPARATVTELSAVAARRAAPSRGLRILGVAAALLLLALAVPLLARMGSDSDDDEAATVADSEGGDATEEAAGADDSTAGGGGAPSTQAQADAYSAGDEAAAESELTVAGSLGRFDDAGSLSARVAELLGDEDLSAPRPATSSSPERASPEGACAAEADGASEAGASIILVGTAVLEGRAVQVTVVERADGRRTLTAADGAESCDAVLTVDLDG